MTDTEQCEEIIVIVAGYVDAQVIPLQCDKNKDHKGKCVHRNRDQFGIPFTIKWRKQ